MRGHVIVGFSLFALQNKHLETTVILVISPDTGVKVVYRNKSSKILSWIRFYSFFHINSDLGVSKILLRLSCSMERAAWSVWTLVVGSCTAVSRTWFALPGTSRNCSQCVGLRQGCPLAHILFIILMDRIYQRSQVMGFHLGTPQPQPVQTPALRQTVPWPEVQRCAGLWKLLANRHKTVEHFYRTGPAEMVQLDISWWVTLRGDPWANPGLW